MAARNLDVMVERSICEDRETPILLTLSSGLLECEKSMLRGPPGLVAPVDSGAAGLAATAGVDERRAVTKSTPEMPNREALESHQLIHIPFAPCCRACVAGRDREPPHFRHGGGEETAAARQSCCWTFSSV